MVDILIDGQELNEAIRIMTKNLPHIRQIMGWTQADLANLLGLSRATICGVETGKARMTKTLWLALHAIIEASLYDVGNYKEDLDG